MHPPGATCTSTLYRPGQAYKMACQGFVVVPLCILGAPLVYHWYTWCTTGTPMVYHWYTKGTTGAPGHGHKQKGLSTRYIPVKAMIKVPILQRPEPHNNPPTRVKTLCTQCVRTFPHLSSTLYDRFKPLPPFRYGYHVLEMYLCFYFGLTGLHWILLVIPIINYNMIMTCSMNVC